MDPPKEVRITLQPSSGKPLSKTQKSFERELRRVESLRAEYDRRVAEWTNLLRTYEKEIHPAELEMNRQRLLFTRALAGFWDQPRGLGRKQRQAVQFILIDQIEAARVVESELFSAHPWVAELHGRLLEAQRQLAEKDREAFAEEFESLDPEEKAVNTEVFKEFVSSMGLDPDAFSVDMDWDTLTKEVWRQMEAGPRASEPPRSSQSGASNPAQRRAAQKAEEREKARQRSMSSIYKELAKALHPDLEPDADVRARKGKVMQELTAAYRNQDLHTLLRLELEWLQGEDQRVASLTDDKLKIYLEVLREQTETLRDDIESVPLEPRFRVVSRFASPWSSTPADARGILERIRRDSDQMETCASRLAGPGSKQLLRELVRQRREMDRIRDEQDWPF